MRILRKVLVIGAGQIGSRHLQGLLKIKFPLDIVVVDKSQESLKITKERAAEIPNNHSVSYFTSTGHISGSFDVAIIATSANVRFQAISNMLGKVNFRYVILEKILFQEEVHYNQIEEVFHALGVEKAWVNLPLKTYAHYNLIGKNLASLNERLVMTVSGASWGLACNTVHYLDLFQFFANDKISQLQTDNIDKQILSSKRSGFIEFTGTILAKTNNGSVLMLNCFPGETNQTTVSISTSSSRYMIQEGLNYQISKMLKSDNFKLVIQEFECVFQSNLTNHFVEEILHYGTCPLSSLGNILDTHKLFINEMLKFYNNLNGTDLKSCPIT